MHTSEVSARQSSKQSPSKAQQSYTVNAFFDRHVDMCPLSRYQFESEW